MKVSRKRPARPRAAPPIIPKASAPAHVAIVGLGPSCEGYVDMVKRIGNRRRFCDETWTINSLGDVLACDRIFHMDDVRIQEIRAAARPDSNIAYMLEWMRKHPGPIYTSRVHPDYPGLVAFPLEDVINSCGEPYFNNTAAYAIAYAVHIGVKRISLFGCDYTYPNVHQAEKGRACAEFHLGIACARGIEICVPNSSSLMDSISTQQDRLYGYDTLAIAMTGDVLNEPARLHITPRETLPTADEIEARYDHSKHPNPQVK